MEGYVSLTASTRPPPPLVQQAEWLAEGGTVRHRAYAVEGVQQVQQQQQQEQECKLGSEKMSNGSSRATMGRGAGRH